MNFKKVFLPIRKSNTHNYWENNEKRNLGAENPY